MPCRPFSSGGVTQKAMVTTLAMRFNEISLLTVADRRRLPGTRR
jgi:hypothetical protein